ncbi:MAG: hypothetical protein ACI81R_001380 [Bradymonadia bacterium]|jgi:hypothetical protein
MSRLPALLVVLALTLPAFVSAQRTPAPAAVERAEEGPDAPEAGTARPAIEAPVRCEVAVQIPEEAVTADGQVSVALSGTLPPPRWTHIMVTHRSGRLAEGEPPPTDAVVEALAALDRNGDGMLDEGELEGRVRGGNGISIEVELPLSACE